MSGHRMCIARWVMFVVALTGLMAMHGLSDHGVGGADPMAHAAAAAHAGMDAGPADVDPGDEHGGQGGHGDSMVGLCLAVLAALLFGFIWRRARLIRVLATQLGDLVAKVALSICARSVRPAAPDLRLLSIQRC